VTDILDRDDRADAGGGGVDAFRVLGLHYDPDLTDADVRRAYLLRLRAVHPDSGGDAAAAAAVTAAYDALRSGVRRGELLAAATVDRGDIPDVGRAGRGRGPARRPGRRPARGPGPGRVPDAARRAELRSKVAASRAAQGLPPFVTDEATLAKIADLLGVMLGRKDNMGDDFPRPVGAAWQDAERPVRVEEPSSWRRERRRWRAGQRERAQAGQVRPVLAGPPRPVWWRAWARVRHGRPGWLLVRVLLAAAVPLAAELAAPGDPAVPALAAGALTWLVLTARFDLAPRARR
jgi:curved DNA-binding protein CbpA